ncbi:MAG: hypothetical protein QG612_2878, partial [Pseudomonadota bacterium]|nr:hypothetical protein [Pseudomonadota bacterium]
MATGSIVPIPGARIVAISGRATLTGTAA